MGYDAPAMTGPSHATDPNRARGVLLVVAAGAIWSVAGPMVRAVDEAEVWQVLFYKSFWMIAALGGGFVMRHRGASLATLAAGGRWILIGGLCMTLSTTGWILSITTTSVANTLLLQAAGPMAAALIAWALLGERTTTATWFAMALALAGVAVMVGDGALDGRLFGNLAGVVAMVAFGGFAVTLRAARGADMTPAMCVGGALAMVVSAVMARDLAMNAWDHGLCFLMGTFETGLGLWLFTAGARHVPAGELVLLAMIEVFLGPLIVWALFGEVPALGSLAGGALVVIAIAGPALRALRRRPG
jgi:drug/metabolite transporter (DMT)-like permease